MAKTSPSPADILLQLQDKAKALGFVAMGVAPATAAPLAAQRLREWLDKGYHGDMLWMEGRADQRASPDALWPEVQSVIMLGMSYAPEGDALAGLSQPESGNISVYARGKDYHDVIKKALKVLARWMVEESGCELKVFVDTAPVLEKHLAQAAGIGWQGKHSNIVSRTEGSWLFLGAIMTTLDFAVDTPHTPHCGSCSACLEACPTQAFEGPYVLDARKCISYLTIEYKGIIPHEYREAIGNRIYGCDDCLAVCPWNRFAQASHAHQALVGRPENDAPALADLLILDDAAFRARFSGSPIKRIGRNRMIRNALIAAGNSGIQSLVPLVQTLCSDNDAVVAEAAHWAQGRLSAAL